MYQVLAEEDLMGEDALGSLPREDLVAFLLLEEPLPPHDEGVLLNLNRRFLRSPLPHGAACAKSCGGPAAALRSASEMGGR